MGSVLFKALIDGGLSITTIVEAADAGLKRGSSLAGRV